MRSLLLTLLALLVPMLALSGCGTEGESGEEPTELVSNREMAARLADLAAERLPQRGAFSTGQMIEYFRELTEVGDTRSQTVARLRLSQALLAHGETEEAVEAIELVRQTVEANPTLFKPRFLTSVIDAQAISYLRLAEERNCLLAHNVDSCLFPIRGGGVHVDPEPAKRALELYRELLEAKPGDLTSRWLLNLAARTAGQFPEGVPEALRIEDAAFESEFEVPRFREVAGPAGLAVNELSGSVVAEDLTGDGLLDLMVSSWLLDDPLRFFVNLGNGRFEERTQAAGLEGLHGGLNLVHADYDNDGFADVFVLRGAWRGRSGRHPNSLLRNRGDGTFEEVTEAAGLLDYHPTQTAAWADFDGDGWLDLFVGNETTPGEPHRSRLFRNRGDGTFEDVAEAAGVDLAAMVKAVVWGDYDNDGRPDLYVSILNGKNRLFRNEGPDEAGSWTFRDVAAEAGVQAPLVSFPTWFFDYDNDGWLDLFVSGFGEDYVSARMDSVVADFLGQPVRDSLPRLYRNRGDGTFEDRTEESGLRHVYFTMGSNFGDLDNDGFPDFYLGTGAPDFRNLMPNRMLRNDGVGTFQDVTSAGGFGHLQKGHGVAFADLDNDGDQDVYAVMGGAYRADVYPNALFENPSAGTERAAPWFGIELEGTTSNRSAIGTRVRLQVESPAGVREIYSRVSTGGSFGSAPLRRHIGLGDATRIVELEVRWPSGAVQRFGQVEPNRRYRLREGAGELEVVELPTFRLGEGGTEGGHHH